MDEKAMQAASLNRLLRRRAEEQAAIARLGYSALAGESLQSLMEQAVHLVAEQLEVEYCKVLELLPEGDRLLLRAGVGWHEGLVGQATVSAGVESQAGYTLLSDHPVVVQDLPSEARFSGPPLLRDHGVISGISVIIQGRERPFGVLGTHTARHRLFAEDEVHFVQAVANVIGGAVQRDEDDRALRKASSYNRNLIEASLDPLVAIGPNGTITDVNAATEAVTGRSRNELIGTDFSDYFTEPAKAKEGYERVFREGFVRDYALEILHADGHTTPVLYNAAVYRDETGSVVGVFATARDISERKRAEDALRQSEARLNQAQHIARIGSWELDLVHDVLLWSDEIYRIFEIDKERFGASYEAFLNAVHPEDRDAVNAAFTDSVQNGTPYSIDHRLLFPDGRIKYVHEQCETTYDSDGRPLRSLGTVQDITERKRAELEVVRLSQWNRLLLDSVGEGIYGLDTEGRCTFINPVAVKMLGFDSADEVIGKPAHDLFHHTRADGRPYPESECLVQRSHVIGETNRGADEVYWRKDRSSFPIEYVSTPIYEQGRVVGAVVAFLDITERKRAEQALRQFNLELERRVEERTAALEEANHELESFSYSVSHDLRMPLRALDGFSKILLKEYQDRLDDEGKRLLEIVRDSADRMGQLISDILTFSRTGRAEMNPAEIDMVKLAGEVWEEISQGIRDRRIDLRIGMLPPARGDRPLVRQVLANLFGNAVKFTRPREVAVIEVGGKVQDAENVYYVRDNGVGFDMRYADKLFGVFQRLHSAEEFEGTGIGLALVKRIVSRHGGRVWAEGKVGEGATFWFALPRELEAGAAQGRGTP